MIESERLLDLFLTVENEAAAFYEALARRFAAPSDVSSLWSDLAADEREHVRWIQEVRALGGRAAIVPSPPALPIAALEAAPQEIRRLRARIERESYSVVEALTDSIAVETSEASGALADFVAAMRDRLPADRFAAETGAHLRRLAEALDRRRHPEASALVTGLATKAERRFLGHRAILVVDDETDMLDSCARILRRSGHACLTAASGAEALVLLRRERPDLVLTDLRMPEMDGLTLLRHARQVAPEVPVVVYSALATPDWAREALAAGASAYLAKPFTATQLRQTVERILGEPGGRSGRAAGPLG